ASRTHHGQQSRISGPLFQMLATRVRATPKCKRSCCEEIHRAEPPTRGGVVAGPPRSRTPACEGGWMGPLPGVRSRCLLTGQLRLGSSYARSALFLLTKLPPRREVPRGCVRTSIHIPATAWLVPKPLR